MANVPPLVVRDRATIRDDFLTVIENGLRRRGVNPNVEYGSDFYVLAEAVASQIVIIEANALVKADACMPDTAVGEDLARISMNFGLTKQPASGSVGPIVFVTDATTSVAPGAQLTDDAGLIYEVVGGGTYASGVDITIVAKATGTQTNHAEGDILRWVDTPPYASEKVAVGAGGLVNGIDEEDDEALRERLFAFLQNAPKSGNASHLATMAELASPSVQKAFVNPALQGAGSAHVAVTAAPTDTNYSRVLANTTLNGRVIPMVVGQYPEHAELTITTVEDVVTDVAFALTLPDAANASPPGPGGGWLDGSPWPAPDGATTFRVKVTAVTTTKQFTVDATTAPTDGVSQICWFSPIDKKLYQATVVTHSGSSGAYVITLDKPFVGIAANHYIWPACQNAQAYVDSVVKAYAIMGPGEKTSNASLLTWAFRRPRPSAGWPMTLGGHLTRAITIAQEEVESAQFLHRTDGTTTLTGNGGVVTPQLPSVVTNPPKIFIPRNIAFYRTP